MTETLKKSKRISCSQGWFLFHDFGNPSFRQLLPRFPRPKSQFRLCSLLMKPNCEDRSIVVTPSAPNAEASSTEESSLYSVVSGPIVVVALSSLATTPSLPAICSCHSIIIEGVISMVSGLQSPLSTLLTVDWMSSGPRTRPSSTP